MCLDLGFQCVHPQENHSSSFWCSIPSSEIEKDPNPDHEHNNFPELPLWWEANASKHLLIHPQSKAPHQGVTTTSLAQQFCTLRLRLSVSPFETLWSSSPGWVRPPDHDSVDLLPDGDSRTPSPFSSKRTGSNVDLYVYLEPIKDLSFKVQTSKTGSFWIHTFIQTKHPKKLLTRSNNPTFRPSRSPTAAKPLPLGALTTLSTIPSACHAFLLRKLLGSKRRPIRKLATSHARARGIFLGWSEKQKVPEANPRSWFYFEAALISGHGGLAKFCKTKQTAKMLAR